MSANCLNNYSNNIGTSGGDIPASPMYETLILYLPYGTTVEILKLSTTGPPLPVMAQMYK